MKSACSFSFRVKVHTYYCGARVSSSGKGPYITRARAHTHTFPVELGIHLQHRRASVGRAPVMMMMAATVAAARFPLLMDIVCLAPPKRQKKKKFFFLPLSLAPRCHVPFIVVYFNSRRIATKESLSTLLTFFFFSYQIRSRERKKELNFKVLDKKISFKNIPLIISPLAAAMVAAAGFFFFFHVSTHNIGWNH